MEFAEELGTVFKYSGTGGLQSTDLWNILQGGGVGGSFIWFINVGDEPLHGTGPGKLLSQGR